MSYIDIGTFKEKEHLFVLNDSRRDGRDFALWFSRQLNHRHKKQLLINTNSLPKIINSGRNVPMYFYEYPLVMEKAWLDRTVIHKDIKWYLCGSVHLHFINGFYGGLFSGIFNKFFTSWPITNLMFPKTLPKGMARDDYPARLISQWTLNGVVRTFRVLSLSIAAALIYDFSSQILFQLRNKEDYINPIFSGGITGGIIGYCRDHMNGGYQRGLVKCKSTALLFAFLVSLYEQMDFQNYKLHKESFQSTNSAFFF